MHEGCFEEFYLLGYKALLSVESQRRPACYRCMLFFYLDYSSSLNMEPTCFCEALVGFQQTIWPYIPEDSKVNLFLCVTN